MRLTRVIGTTMRNLIVRALDKWKFALFPPTREKVIALGAALKMGRYASADNYLYHYKALCARENHDYDVALRRLHLDVIRSCKRGMGGPVRPLALPL